MKGWVVSDRHEIDIPTFKARITERRDELVQLTESAAGARRPVELDQTRVGRLSRMDALQSQAMSLETERRRQVAAAAKTAQGQYRAPGQFPIDPGDVLAS